VAHHLHQLAHLGRSGKLSSQEKARNKLKRQASRLRRAGSPH
jgi:hypothetical protein